MVANSHKNRHFKLNKNMVGFGRTELSLSLSCTEFRALSHGHGFRGPGFNGGRNNLVFHDVLTAFLGTPFQATSGRSPDPKNPERVTNVSPKTNFFHVKEAGISSCFLHFVVRKSEAQYKKKTAFRPVF